MASNIYSQQSKCEAAACSCNRLSPVMPWSNSLGATVNTCSHTVGLLHISMQKNLFQNFATGPCFSCNVTVCLTCLHQLLCRRLHRHLPPLPALPWPCPAVSFPSLLPHLLPSGPVLQSQPGLPSGQQQPGACSFMRIWPQSTTDAQHEHGDVSRAGSSLACKY